MSGIYVMDQMKDIEGIDILLSKLPESCHRWDTFNFIDGFKYQTVFDDTDKYDYINNIEMVIRDEQKKYWLKMLLTDVSGRINYNMLDTHNKYANIIHNKRGEFLLRQSTLLFKIFS